MLYIRRLIWYFATRLLIICVIAGMLVCGFFMCMNMANAYIIITEGLEKRVEVILTKEDAQELNKCFHYDFLNADPALRGAFDGTSVYDDYTISDFEYDLTVERLWAWPWDNYATCTVVERVPSITGKVISNRVGEISSSVPKWEGGRYNITLVRSGGNWKILGMQQVTRLLTPDESPNDSVDVRIAN